MPPPHPDPARGVFETLLVVDGEPVELAAHLDRIAGAVDELYDAELPTAAGEVVRARSAGLALGRVRLNVVPDAGALSCEAVARAIDPDIVFPTWECGAELRGLVLAGGLGPHKLVDRPALPDATGTIVPLLLEADGEVLEAGRANVFVAQRGVLVTPAADGRILPGLTRAAVLAIAGAEGVDVEQRPLRREELVDADEVFLTGSVRGVEPVRSLDGVPLAAGTEIGGLIAAGLRRRYGTPHRTPATTGRRA